MQRSFIKNGKEHKNVAFFWKERMPNPAITVLYFDGKLFKVSKKPSIITVGVRLIILVSMHLVNDFADTVST